MIEQLISLETAILAKELGFGWECNTYFTKTSQEDGWVKRSHAKYYSENWNYYYDNFNFSTLSAPTQSLLQKWLRDVHNIIVEVTVFSIDWFEDGKFAYKVWIFPDKQKHFTTPEEYKTWEEALEIGLQESLKIVKNKQL